ncbi:MAG TPA: prolipoprotein diacylglyceryl transferase family protein [Bacilli bacterium]|nr:prolipoprotein diacylglyceryl transferase family protein [Bacilli bacterium]
MYPYELFWGISLYGVFVTVGIILCIITLRVYGKKIGIDPKFLDFVELNTYVAIAIGFFASAVWQGLYDYISNPELGFKLTSGITFIGGLMGGTISFLIGYWLFGRNKYNSKLIDILPLVPCCILIAHAFGRIGCFSAGCCYGKPTDSWLGIVFPEGSPSYYAYGAGVAVYPTQLFEAIFLILMFALTSYLLLNKKFKYNICVYLFGYGIFRFLIEYIRADDRGQFIGMLSPSQFWSLIMIVLAVVVYFLIKKVSKEEKDKGLIR